VLTPSLGASIPVLKSELGLSPDGDGWADGGGGLDAEGGGGVSRRDRKRAERSDHGAVIGTESWGRGA
jgi:hypothetical protein